MECPRSNQRPNKAGAPAISWKRTGSSLVSLRRAWVHWRQWITIQCRFSVPRHLQLCLYHWTINPKLESFSELDDYASLGETFDCVIILDSCHLGYATRDGNLQTWCAEVVYSVREDQAAFPKGIDCARKVTTWRKNGLVVPGVLVESLLNKSLDPLAGNIWLVFEYNNFWGQVLLASSRL